MNECIYECGCLFVTLRMEYMPTKNFHLLLNCMSLYIHIVKYALSYINYQFVFIDICLCGWVYE